MTDFVCSEPFGIQLQYVWSWILGSISAAETWVGSFMNSQFEHIQHG